MATVYEFNYIGAEQSVALPPGKYVIECWGACGGNFPDFKVCAKGSYSAGVLVLKESTKFYIYVGQGGFAKGANGIETRRSGFNGAGGIETYTSTSSGYYSLAGGGSTDIRLVGGAWDNPQGLLSRILVAGGAGGSYGTGYYSLGHGGGLDGKKGIPIDHYYLAGGGSQFEGGSAWNVFFNGSFGLSPASFNNGGYSIGTGGGGGWYGGAGIGGTGFGGGGSGYALTKDSYKPPGYIPTSKYYFTNVTFLAGKNESTQNGFVKFTLIQALPFLTVSSYNSTQSTFKADHTDSTLLTKIEVFLDDILKETITTDLTAEKTINYTLEDNALHTLKIVVTDSSNATAEKVLSISKNIMPLGDDASLQDIASKVSEMKDGLINGKTSIINVLGLKNIEASLNNTLVDLSEKIKFSFDSGDASVGDLMNQLTNANNTISQLNAKYKVASGTIYSIKSEYNFANYYGRDYGYQPVYWVSVTGLDFIPNFFVAESEYTYNNLLYKHLIFTSFNVFSKDFTVNSYYQRRVSDGGTFDAYGEIFQINERDVYVSNLGVKVPAHNNRSNVYKWYAVKFK